MNKILGLVAVLLITQISTAKTPVKNTQPAQKRGVASVSASPLTIDLGEQTAPVGADLTSKVVSYQKSKHSLAAQVGVGQGRVSRLSVVRCYDPAGTDNPKDKPYCEYLEIKSTSENAVELGDKTAAVDSEIAKKLMIYQNQANSLMPQVGLNQGWSASIAVLRCESPEGTGNKKDQPSCEYREVKAPAGNEDAEQ